MFSKRLKEEINNFITDDHVEYAKKIGTFRRHLIKKVKDPDKRAEIMAEIGNIEMKDMLHLSVKALLEKFIGTAGDKGIPNKGS